MTDNELMLREALNSAAEGSLYDGANLYDDVERHFGNLIPSRIVHIQQFMTDCYRWKLCRADALDHRRIGDEIGAAMLEAEQAAAYSSLRHQLNLSGPLPLPLLRLIDDIYHDENDTLVVTQFLQQNGYDVR